MARTPEKAAVRRRIGRRAAGRDPPGAAVRGAAGDEGAACRTRSRRRSSARRRCTPAWARSSITSPAAGPTLVFIHGDLPRGILLRMVEGVPAIHRQPPRARAGFDRLRRVRAPGREPHGDRLRHGRWRSSSAGHATSRSPSWRAGWAAGLSVLLASQHPEVVRQLLLWMPTGLTELGAAEVSPGQAAGEHGARWSTASSTAIMNPAAPPCAAGWRCMASLMPARITEETLDVYATCAQQYGAEHAIRNLYAGPPECRTSRSACRCSSQPVSFLWPGAAGVDAHPSCRAACKPWRAAAALRFAPRLSQLAAVEAPAEIAALLADELDPGPKVVR